MAWSAYKRWVRTNSSLLSAVEGAASSLTWLLPDRFSESEMTLEGINSAIGLLSIWHESILAEGSPKGAVPGAGLSWALAAIQQLEVLVEIGAMQASGKAQLRKYDALALLEAVKAALRIALLHRSGGRMLLNGGASIPPTSSTSAATSSSRTAAVQEVQAAFARFRARHIPAHSAASTDAAGDECCDDTCTACTDGRAAAAAKRPVAFWWEAPAPRRMPSSLLPPGPGPSSLALAWGGGGSAPVTRRDWRVGAGGHMVAAGELLHVLRPFAYVLALRRWGPRSWKAWWLSLALEVSALQLTAAGAALEGGGAASGVGGRAGAGGDVGGGEGGGKAQLSSAEAAELGRRKLLLALYLLRSPFFERYAAPRVKAVRRGVSNVPLLGGLVDKAVEILLGVQSYYTYTAGS